mmetsp:Transcript_69677/g.181273  ORF Transcript_69677/g.181273 Transcript_69677/m.181273 type:complete len:244 (+) Transcript_69677:373-1104(+)
MCFSSKAQDKSLQMAFSTSIISATGAQKCALSRKPAASCDQHGNRLASATAGALADADVACPHNVGAVAEPLRDAAVQHRPLGLLLLAVKLHLLNDFFLLIVQLAGARLPPLLVLRLLLPPILGVDEAHDMHFVGQSHGRRQHQHLALLHPAHVLERVNHRRGIGHGRCDLPVRELQAAEFLLAGVAHHVARHFLEELQDFLGLLQGQGPQCLLQRGQGLCHPVSWSIARIAHFAHKAMKRWG